MMEDPADKPPDDSGAPVAQMEMVPIDPKELAFRLALADRAKFFLTACQALAVEMNAPAHADDLRARLNYMIGAVGLALQFTKTDEKTEAHLPFQELLGSLISISDGRGSIVLHAPSKMIGDAPTSTGQLVKIYAVAAVETLCNGPEKMRLPAACEFVANRWEGLILNMPGGGRAKSAARRLKSWRVDLLQRAARDPHVERECRDLAAEWIGKSAKAKGGAQATMECALRYFATKVLVPSLILRPDASV